MQLLSHANLGVSQKTKSKENGNSRPVPKGVRRHPKTEGGRVQSILTQVLDKGHFLRLSGSIILNPGKTLELRCKGPKIGWAYPSYLDAFNDSRLRYFSYIAQLLFLKPFLFVHIVLLDMNMSRVLV